MFLSCIFPSWNLQLKHCFFVSPFAMFFCKFEVGEVEQHSHQAHNMNERMYYKYNQLFAYPVFHWGHSFFACWVLLIAWQKRCFLAQNLRCLNKNDPGWTEPTSSIGSLRCIWGISICVACLNRYKFAGISWQANYPQHLFVDISEFTRWTVFHHHQAGLTGIIPRSRHAKFKSFSWYVAKVSPPHIRNARG